MALQYTVSQEPARAISELEGDGQTDAAHLLACEAEGMEQAEKQRPDGDSKGRLRSSVEVVQVVEGPPLVSQVRSVAGLQKRECRIHLTPPCELLACTN